MTTSLPGISQHKSRSNYRVGEPSLPITTRGHSSMMRFDSILTTLGAESFFLGGVCAVLSTAFVRLAVGSSRKSNSGGGTFSRASPVELASGCDVTKMAMIKLCQHSKLEHLTCNKTFKQFENTISKTTEHKHFEKKYSCRTGSGNNWFVATALHLTPLSPWFVTSTIIKFIKVTLI